MKLTHFLAALAATTITSNAATILSYDATGGQTPDDQGWTHYEILEGDISDLSSGDSALYANMEGNFTDGANGTVLNLNDQNSNGSYNLPAFAQDRTEAQDIDMYNNGLQLTVVGKNLGGWFVGFGFNSSNTSFQQADNITAADRRFGFNLNSAANDGAYHTYVVDGSLDGSNNYNFTLSVDGGAATALAIQTNTAPTSYDQGLYLTGGSSGGTSGAAMIRSIHLASIPEPSSTALLGLGGLALILRRRK